MIKRTLYFGNPAYLSLHNAQLVIDSPKGQEPDNVNDIRTIPVEDIGVVVLDHPQITLTHGLIDALLENTCVLITCNSRRMPVGMVLPLCGNTTQNERFRAQLEASLPLKKQLWQQTVQAKIENQAAVLRTYTRVKTQNMQIWAADVKSNDSDNLEARAAVYYWANIFPSVPGFTRDRGGISPNHFLNYGYAILRAVVARALVASGMLPTLGIHHHNRYNAYCLADDIMEPYRPFVDRMVIELVNEGRVQEDLNKELKARLLSIPVVDVSIGGKRSPLMIAVAQTTASLNKCFEGQLRRIQYPEF